MRNSNGETETALYSHTAIQENVDNQNNNQKSFSGLGVIGVASVSVVAAAILLIMITVSIYFIKRKREDEMIDQELDSVFTTPTSRTPSAHTLSDSQFISRSALLES